MRSTWILGLTVSLVAAGCTNSGEKASGDAAADSAVAETPQAYIAKSEQLRREGKHKEAATAALKAYTLAREGPRVAERIELAKAFGAGGNSAGAINEIKTLETEKREQGLAVDEVDIAEVYAQIGDPNAVFRWLQRAVEANSPNLAGVQGNPDLAPVRADPRWQQFLSSIPK